MVLNDEFEYVFHKCVAESIIADLNPLIKKIGVRANKLIEKVSSIEKFIQKETNTAKINKYSKKLDDLREQTINILCVKNRLQLIVERNQARVKFLSEKLKNAGIYVNKLDKKRLAGVKKEFKDKISFESLNLNQNNTDSNIVVKNINGELLVFVDGELDFSQSQNVNVLTGASQDFVLSVIQTYAESVKTIVAKDLLNSDFKKKVLKAVASVVLDGKEQSVKKVNEKFGNLLSFKTEIPKDLEGYVAAVQNMFNVIAKQELMQMHPDKAKEINKKLKCNERSELIPASRKVAIFANGMAGEDEYQEENESEALRISKEREIEEDIFAQFELDMLAIAQELEEEEQMLKNEEIEKEERLKQNLEEQKKEAERKFEKALSKNDIDGD